MKRLFDEKYESYNEDAKILSDLVKKYTEEGYSLRDIELVLKYEVESCISVSILERNAKIFNKSF